MIRAFLKAYWRQLLPAFSSAIGFGSLLVFGLMYLVQRGWLVWWALSAAVAGLLALVARRVLSYAPANYVSEQERRPDIAWSRDEESAWRAVVALAEETNGAPPSTAHQMQLLGEQVIEAVATSLHPGQEFAQARFTVPDLLVAVEVAARDLRRQVVQSVPGSEVIRVSDLQSLHGYYTRYGSIAKALWWAYRAQRMVISPLTALAQESKSLLEGKAMGSAWETVKGRFWKELTLEAGRLTIDLYGGRLRATREELEAAVRAQAPGVASPLPVRILVAGQVNAGKSSLVNALLGDVQAVVSELPATSSLREYRLQAPDRPDLVLIETPGLKDGCVNLPELRNAMRDVDIALWVVSAANPARAVDRHAISALRTDMATWSGRSAPEILVVATHVDLLPPRREWTPPYDIETPDNDKARAICAATAQIDHDLSTRDEVVVPVSLRGDIPPYNLDSLWAALALMLPEARQHALRRVLEGKAGFDVSVIASQMYNGGRVAGKWLLQGALSKLGRLG
jgi:predicted GTPase